MLTRHESGPVGTRHRFACSVGSPPTDFVVVRCEQGTGFLGWLLGPGLRRALPGVMERLRARVEEAAR